MYKLIKQLFLISIVSTIFCSVVARAEEDLSKLFGGQTEFLKVEEAFVLSSEIIDEEIVVRFEIAPEYYMYRSRFGFSAKGATLGDVYIPAGKKKVDEYLGNVEVYYNHLEISMPFTAHQKAFDFTIEYQGCAEAGLCYPPEEVTLTLFADKIDPLGTVAGATDGSSSHSSGGLGAEKDQSVSSSSEEFVPEQEKVVNVLSDKSIAEIVFYFILLGIGLAFTPCVLPMVPILSSIIVGQGKDIKTSKALGLSLSYTQAMAIPYTIIGVAVGAAGEGLANTFQEPIFVLSTAAIFVVLSAGMFGFYELSMPSMIQNRLNSLSSSQESGSYIGAAVMGAISSLVVSPCVTVPLAGVLIYIAQTGDMAIGGVALYSMAVGMGIPLLIVGVGGSKILPKAGAWMNVIKALFGFGMIGMALYITKHLIPGPVYLLSFATLLISCGFYISRQFKGQKAPVVMNILKLGAYAYGAVLVVGGGLGNDRLLQPLHNIEQYVSGEGKASFVDAHSMFTQVKSVDDVAREIEKANAQGKTVMFDFFAESCTACYEFADYTFSDPKVQSALENSVLLQADVTKNDATDKALMKHFGVVGLPSILFIDKTGDENKRFRAIGFEDAEIFERRIKAAFAN